jgi:hypothetical protein
MAKMVMVLIAGTAHAAKWKYWELASMASCPHFNPAARNHVNVKITHQILEAMLKKYSTMNKMVHNSYLVPWVMVLTFAIPFSGSDGSLQAIESPAIKPTT